MIGAGCDGMRWDDEWCVCELAAGEGRHRLRQEKRGGRER